jgi:ribA/ribD-fused uncharacterized protein
MDINILKTKFDASERIKYLFFWGHRPNADGTITKTCFSQWFQSGFEIDGIYYSTAEHYMMAGKARLFNDSDTLAEILVSKHPRDAQKLGRKVANFHDQTWQEHRSQIVIDGNLAKFQQNPQLLAFILGTKERILVEASPTDRIWGIGMADDHPDINNPHKWQGLNLLGFALMVVREQLNSRAKVDEQPSFFLS